MKTIEEKPNLSNFNDEIYTGQGVFSTPYLIRYAAAAISSKRSIRGFSGSHHSSYRSSSLISNVAKLYDDIKNHFFE